MRPQQRKRRLSNMCFVLLHDHVNASPSNRPAASRTDAGPVPLQNNGQIVLRFCNVYPTDPKCTPSGYLPQYTSALISQIEVCHPACSHLPQASYQQPVPLLNLSLVFSGCGLQCEAFLTVSDLYLLTGLIERFTCCVQTVVASCNGGGPLSPPPPASPPPPPSPPTAVAPGTPPTALPPIAPTPATPTPPTVTMLPALVPGVAQLTDFFPVSATTADLGTLSDLLAEFIAAQKAAGK